jgi:SEC-C motif-containing protein
MRSRYSAYVIKNYAYVLASYAPLQRQNLSLQALSESAQNTKWLRLEVLHSTENEERAKSADSKDSSENAESTKSGTVEFIATYAVDADFFSMHELSRFIKQDGHWYYTTGMMQEGSGQIVANRNDPCPCGSNKKYKKCCLLQKV